MVGDLIAAWLSVIGIKQERLQAVTGSPCGCLRRQSWLNEAGVAVQRRARAAIRAATRFW
jgi:hypothetical protein